MNKKILILITLLLGPAFISGLQASCGCAARRAMQAGVNDDVDGVSLEPSAVSRYQRARMKFLGSTQATPVFEASATAQVTEKPKNKLNKGVASKKRSKNRKIRAKRRRPRKKKKKSSRASVVGRPRAKMMHQSTQ